MSDRGTGALWASLIQLEKPRSVPIDEGGFGILEVLSGGTGATSETTPQLMWEITVPAGFEGVLNTFYIHLAIATITPSPDSSERTQLFVNGVAVEEVREGSFTELIEIPVPMKSGDKIQLYGWTVNPVYAYIIEARVIFVNLEYPTLSQVLTWP